MTLSASDGGFGGYRTAPRALLWRRCSLVAQSAVGVRAARGGDCQRKARGPGGHSRGGM